MKRTNPNPLSMNERATNRGMNAMHVLIRQSAALFSPTPMGRLLVSQLSNLTTDVFSHLGLISTFS